MASDQPAPDLAASGQSGGTVAGRARQRDPHRSDDVIVTAPIRPSEPDVLARRDSSFLKDFAPLAGRDVRVTPEVGI